MRAFAREGARDFDDDYWSVLIHEGSNKMRMEYYKDSNGSFCYLRGHSRTLLCSSNKSRIDELHAYSLNMEGVPLLQREFVDFSIHFGSGVILGGKEKDNNRFFVQP